MVYQAGKVASKSIERSLTTAGYVSTCPHTMGRLFRNHNYPNYRNANCKGFRGWVKLTKMFIKRKILLYFYKRRKMKIITLVREPISRNISMFFQNLEIPLIHIAKNSSLTRVENTSLHRLIDEYFVSFNQKSGMDWFDNELKRYFGVDVYEYDFDRERGYSTIRSGDIEVLIIKFEKLREVGEKCIGEFIGNSDFKIKDYNVSSDKWYSPVYENFKNEVQFDENYLNEMLNNKYLKHFYTTDEIDNFRMKYSINNGEVNV